MADITRVVNYVIEVTGGEQAAGALGDVASSSTAAAGAQGNLTEQFTLGNIAGNLYTQAINMAIQAVKQLASDALRLTIQMEDLAGAMDLLYKDLAPGLREELDALSESTGWARSELYEMTTNIGAMLVPLGMARDEAAEMSLELAELSINMAAALGKESTETSAALEAAIRGRTRALREYGIVITEASINQELLNMGIRGGASEATEAEKAMARYNIIMESSAMFSGAAAEEADTLEGSIRNLQRVYENLAQGIGDALGPSLTILINAFSDLLEALSPVIELIMSTVGSGVITLMGNALQQVADIIAFSVSGYEQLFTLLGLINQEYFVGVDAIYAQSDAYQNLTVAELQHAAAVTLNRTGGRLTEDDWAYLNLVKAQIIEVRNLDVALKDVQENMDIYQDEKKRMMGMGGPSYGAGMVAPGVATPSIPDEEWDNIRNDIAQIQIYDGQITVQRRAQAAIQRQINSDIEKTTERFSEEQQMWFDQMVEIERYAYQTFSGVFRTMFDDFERLDEFVLSMIKRWAADLIAAFAVQGFMNIITGGALGATGMLGGAKGKFVK